MRRSNRKSDIGNQQSQFSRFVRDEGGQGIVFAAATLLLLVGFVALVYNIGRVVDRRTKMQLAADSAAYAAATVEGNSLSAIGWINSAMAQVYYCALKYAVDVNVTGVAAVLDCRLNNNIVDTTSQSYLAYLQACKTAYAGLPQARQWLVDLSRIENAIAILTPRLAEEETYAVAGEVGAERISVYPSFRMFPHNDSTRSFSIQRQPNGWTITDITPGGNANSLTVTLNGNMWDLQYTHDGIVTHEVQITQTQDNGQPEWDIKYFQPPGTPGQEISLVNTNGLGWVVWGSSGNPPAPVPSIQFAPIQVQTPEGVTVSGTMVSQGGSSQVLWMGSDGNLYQCIQNSQGNWTVAEPALTSNQTTIAGVNVQVNVTNQIQFPGGAVARVGNPTTVDIGGAHVVLSNPPNISTSFGPVRISINGFDPNSFNISVGGWNLTPGDSNGQWRKYFDPIEELWWRNRLTVMGLDANGVPNSWQYDYQVLGALLTYDNPAALSQPWPGRFATHALNDSLYTTLANWPDAANGSDPANTAAWPAWGGYENPPAVTTNNGWFDPTPFFTAYCTAPSSPLPINFTWSPQGSVGFLLPPGAYCQTAFAQDGTEIRVGIPDLNGSPVAIQVMQTLGFQPKVFPVDYFLTAPMFVSTTGSNLYIGLPKANLPLVLAEDYFKYGVNVGVWKSPESPMLFPTPGPGAYSYDLSNTFAANPTGTPSAINGGYNNPSEAQEAFFYLPRTTTSTLNPQWWGAIAVASARVGIKSSVTPVGYVFNFDMTGYGGDDTSSPRAQWCDTSPYNLYLADVNVKLLPSKELKSDEANSQVQQADLDEDLLQGAPVAQFYTPGSATAYLWGAILASHQNYPFQGNDWLPSFNGQADPRVGQALQNMQNRSGARFDFNESNSTDATTDAMASAVQH